MLTIRLSRIGKKNKPMYRLVISEKRRDPYGRSLEILGSFNPHTKDLQAKGERIKYWLGQGAQMSPTVNNLLIEKGIIEGKKVKASKARKKKGKAGNEEAPKGESQEAEKEKPSTEEPKAEPAKDELKQEKNPEAPEEENKDK